VAASGTFSVPATPAAGTEVSTTYATAAAACTAADVAIDGSGSIDSDAFTGGLLPAAGIDAAGIVSYSWKLLVVVPTDNSTGADPAPYLDYSASSSSNSPVVILRNAAYATVKLSLTVTDRWGSKVATTATAGASLAAVPGVVVATVDDSANATAPVLAAVPLSDLTYVWAMQSAPTPLAAGYAQLTLAPAGDRVGNGQGATVTLANLTALGDYVLTTAVSDPLAGTSVATTLTVHRHLAPVAVLFSQPITNASAPEATSTRSGRSRLLALSSAGSRDGDVNGTLLADGYSWRVTYLGTAGLPAEQMTPDPTTLAMSVPASDVEVAVLEARVLEPANDPFLLALDLADALAASPVVYACSPLAPGAYRVELVVTDSLGAVSSNPAAVTFYVGSDGAPALSLPPTAAKPNDVALVAALTITAVLLVAIAACLYRKSIARGIIAVRVYVSSSTARRAILPASADALTVVKPRKVAASGPGEEATLPSENVAGTIVPAPAPTDAGQAEPSRAANARSDLVVQDEGAPATSPATDATANPLDAKTSPSTATAAGQT
jgi:hypothetical protein